MISSSEKFIDVEIKNLMNMIKLDFNVILNILFMYLIQKERIGYIYLFIF